MATRLTSSYHSSNPAKSRKSSVSSYSPWLSVNYGTRDDIPPPPPASPPSHKESFNPENQLHEPLLEVRADDVPVKETTPQKYGGVGMADNRSFRKRAKKWRKSMGLPKTRRTRKKTVYDAFIDSSKNTPRYVKSCTSDNLLA